MLMLAIGASGAILAIEVTTVLVIWLELEVTFGALLVCSSLLRCGGTLTLIPTTGVGVLLEGTTVLIGLGS